MNVHDLRRRLAVFLLAGGAALAVGCKSEPVSGPLLPVPNLPCVAGCANNVLTYCNDGKAVVENCNTNDNSAGKPSTCTFIEDDNDYYCIADSGGGCGEETVQGRCDGTKVISCRSIEGGDSPQKMDNVDSFDCATVTDGYTACAVAPDGQAGCAIPGTTGCGGVPEDGYCDGELLSKCVNSTVVETDCSATGKKCGLLADNSASGCLSAAVFKTGVGDMAKVVSGTVVYEKRVVDTSSYAAAQMGFAPGFSLIPVRRAQVQLIAEDGTEIQRSFTDETGAFSLFLPAATTKSKLVVSSVSDPNLNPLTVNNCPPSPDDVYPAGCTDEQGSAYQYQSALLTGTTALGQVVISEASGLGGAFNIFNLMLKGQEFARINFNGGKNPATPPLSVQWKKGYETTTSYLGQNGIVVQGIAADTDEYDDPVLMHEFGHFLERAFSVSDSPGGSHDGSATDPRLAFGEGYGTYVGCRIAGSSLYFDSGASGVGVTNINATGRKANANDARGIKQLLSEYMVGETLWHLDLGTGGNTVGGGATGGLGSGVLFDVLGGYFKGNAKLNKTHGFSGRELVKFIDGLFCRDYQGKAAASAAIIQTVVTTNHDFPYDDYSHKIAPIGSCK